MVMGMAGWFLSGPDTTLGTMHLRDQTLRFAAWPRPAPFKGRVAVVVDGFTACASEVLAAALRDLAGARLFGTRTGGATQGGELLRLPNGDGFLFAVADFRQRNGQPIEGVGLEPEVQVDHTRAALLAGQDLPMQTALDWILADTSTPTVSPKEFK